MRATASSLAKARGQRRPAGGGENRTMGANGGGPRRSQLRKATLVPRSAPAAAPAAAPATTPATDSAKTAKKPKFTVRTSHGLARFSLDGRLAAFANGTAVVVVRVPSIEHGTGNEAGGFKVECRFSCVDTVENIDWSADSMLVMCAQYKRALVQVFSVKDRAFTCRASEGVGGLVYATLAPDGRHLISVADFQLHFSVWSLVDETQRCFMNPKLTSAQGFRFSPDGDFLAVAHRRECKDSVAVYSTAKGRWAKLQHFTVASTDLEEIIWGADNDAIIVRDCPIEYRLLVYNPADGSLLARYSAYEHALGIKSVTYSTASKLAAVGSFDNVCRILNTMTWRPIAECDHPNSIVLRNSGIRWISQRAPAADTADAAANPANSSTTNTGVHKFVVVKPDMKKPLPKSGIGLIAWSFDGQFIATRDDQKPFVVWIWKMDTLTPFAILELSGKINSFKWDPCQIRLAIASGDSCAYLWTPQCEDELVQAHAWSPDPSEPVSTEGVLGIKWSSNGDTLLLLSKTQTAFALVN